VILGLFLTAIFVLLNGFFVAGEFALVKLRATQIESIARLNTSRSRAAVSVCRQLDRYLSATQLGITLASLGLGSVAEPSVAGALVTMGAGAHLSTELLHRIAHTGAFSVLTAAHIIAGELVPKLIAIRSAEKVALGVARPLQVFYWISQPVLFILNAISSVILKLMGFPSLHDAEGALSEEEILGVLARSYARGSLSEQKRTLLESVVRFADRTARHVMLPRPDVAYFDADLPIAAAVERARADGFTRYPVVEANNLDKPLGYVNIKDLVLAANTPGALRQVLREAIVVPESLKLFDLMREMQRRQIPLAIVVDEYGGTSGIATLEDVLEEIVGEIRDEHDDEAPRVRVRENGDVEADGLATVAELRAAGVELPEGESDTVGGLVLEALRRVARPDDEVTLGAYRVQVESVRRRRVGRVALRRNGADDGTTS